MRAVEALTALLPKAVRCPTAIDGPINETTLGAIVGKLDPAALRACLHAQIKAEALRGNLPHPGLPFGVIALDGKVYSCLQEWDHADVQKVCPKGRTPYGLARVHNACLISAPSKPIVDVVAIAGDTKVTYRVYRVEVAETNSYRWVQLRQFVRLERQIGQTTGHRDWATNMPIKTLSSGQWGRC
jgi:hypothetical protein